MNSNGRSFLDETWRRSGMDGVRRAFSALAIRDVGAVVSHINDDRLSFPVFFIILDDLIKYRLADRLNPRGKTALYICSRKIGRLQPYASAVQPGIDMMYGTARWMLDTGIRWDGPSGGMDAYDAVMDYAITLTVAEFDDYTVLPEVAELIFKRNRQGLYIHDLVWSFFQAVDPDAITLVAGYLGSSNRADRELAATLLAQDIPAEGNGSRSGTAYQLAQRHCLDWLRDNRPYLYLTGEHMQMTSRPKHVEIDLEAKYLDKEISPRRREAVTPLTEDEAECLQRYRQMPPDEQGLLSEYSHKLRSKDKGQWQNWMRRQIAEQVMAAKTDMKDEAI